MNVCAAARRLYTHRNTLEYHLSKVKEETELDPHVFYDLVRLVEIAKEI
jgi:DNA-binding PucR family transcriptional regulator